MTAFWKELKLWDHQIEAVKLGQRYLNAYYRGETNGSALIRMPTGTGKTGVIAVLARLLYKRYSTLILSPATALRDQLERETREDFWSKIGADVSDYPAEVEGFIPSSAKSVLEKIGNKRCVLLSTIQTLTTLYRSESHQDIYKELKQRIRYVFFDEGHREPAKIWAQAARGMGKPIILLSATPYRNDYAYFNIDSKYIYTFSYQEATDGCYIRPVEFREEDFGRDPETFVKTLLDYYDGEFQEIAHPEGQHYAPRVIIRCQTKGAVVAVAAALERNDQSVVAVHERLLSSKCSYHFRRIPESSKTDAVFWVHQYKLVEGIDDPRFQLLAIYDSFANARSLVQQVGRIIRNPDRLSDQVAIVFSNPHDGQQTFWRNYQDYERDYSPLHDPRDLYEKALGVQIPIRYLERNYRRRFDIERKDVHLAFRYPFSANIYVPRRTIELHNLVEKTREEWGKLDRDVRNVVYPDRHTAVLAYVSRQNAPVLLEDYFIELDLGFTIIRSQGNYIFIYDSKGSIPAVLQLEARRVDPDHTSRLFHGDDARASSLSLLNSDIGSHSIRRRTIHAYSVAETGPTLADQGYFCSTLQGYVRDRESGVVGRYVGFTRGRVTDRTRRPSDHNYDGYIRWVRKVANSLDNDGVKPNTLLDRYAVHIGVPEDPTPRHILLDLDDMLEAEAYQHVQEGELLEVEELSGEVRDHFFALCANRDYYNIRVSFDPRTTTYRLTCSDLDNAYTLREGHGDRFQRGITAHLNITQSFRVVPNAEWTIYAHSKFYKPRRSFGGTDDSGRLELLNIFEPMAALGNVYSEKGPEGSATKDGWHPSSVFHVIDSRGTQADQGYDDSLARALEGTDILICDDLQKEVADFIAASCKEQRVVFMHAKADPKVLSASAFHDVCAQALKNLEPLNPYYNWTPPNLSLWEKPWRRSGQEYVEQRIRKGEGTAQELWKAIRNIIRNPAAIREVWIVYGKGFSLNKLREEQLKDNPLPEAVQLLYLLQSTWASLASLNVRFRIFCPVDNA